MTSIPARRRLHRGWNRTIRRLRTSEATWFLLLAAITLVLGAATYKWHRELPLTVLLIPMVIGNQILSPRRLPWFIVGVLAVLVVSFTASITIESAEIDNRRIGGIVVSFVVGLIILIASFRRSRMGVSGTRGESMFVDLRDRISNQGLIPTLPGDWYAEAVMRSAGGSAFAGDFIVASKSRDSRYLEVAVVDVSGKGEQAGTRALLLSGAFGGLLGALPAGHFLPAANEYLLRQEWTEGFATAVHLSLDLELGQFELRSAGHPPAVQLHAGSGRWGVHDTEGPILGLIPNAEFTCVSGTVHRGDAVLLYTDGLVETPQRDISLGIDKLLGQGERLLRSGFESGAQRLIERIESVNDDRALFLLHRR